MENQSAASMQKPGVTLLVALKLNLKSRELLTWILAKQTKPGDHVVGVHVLNSSSASGLNETKVGPSIKQQLANTFQAVLGVYQGLCSLKQIEVDIKIVTGCGFREVLVEMASEEKAAKLILGSGKSHDIRKNCLAKYCVERLPETCSVLVVEQGKIIFEKTGRKNGCDKRKVHLFGASRGMSFNQPNRLDHVLQSRHSVQSFKSSEKRFKNSLFSRSGENTKFGSFDMQGKSDSISSIDATFPSSPVSVLQWANFARYRGSKIHERRSSFQSSSVPEEHAKQVHDDQTIEKDPNHLHVGEKKDRCLEEFDQFCLKLAKMLKSLTFGPTCKSFKFEELELATSSFASRNMVGKGGHSNVYEGVLPDGERVAVKCLNNSKDAEEEFMTEVETLLTFCHRHIVPLLGYCVRGCKKYFLVYQFASNGNLEEFLHGGFEKPVLEWDKRLKIAVGTAHALQYLHKGSPQYVIHRDMKSSNILLTSSFEPQISDFGLAKLASASSPFIACDDVFGTFGYIAPEYFMYGKINNKTDVYAFGVILLELITGRPPVDNSKTKGLENLVLWAKPLLEARNLDELIDPRLKGQYDVKQMNQMIIAAFLCTRQDPESRPCINSVLKLLCTEDDMVTFEMDEMAGVYEDFSDKQTKENLHTTSGSSELSSSLSLAILGVDDDATSECSSGQSSMDLTQSHASHVEDLSSRCSSSSSLDFV